MVSAGQNLIVAESTPRQTAKQLGIGPQNRQGIAPLPLGWLILPQRNFDTNLAMTPNWGLSEASWSLSGSNFNAHTAVHSLSLSRGRVTHARFSPPVLLFQDALHTRTLELPVTKTELSGRRA